MSLPTAPSDNQFRVQIVEDEGDLAQLVARSLQSAGFVTHISPNGTQALKDFPQVSPHLLLCDLSIPGLTGHEVLTRVRAHSAIPILMMSATHSDEAQLRSFKEGADDYIPKPFNPTLLMARVVANLRRTYRYNAEVQTAAAVAPPAAASAPTAAPQAGLPKGFLRCGECPYIGPSWKFNALDENKRPIVQCPSCGNRSVTFNIG